MSKLISIAFGGALGTVLRYGVFQYCTLYFESPFPWGTFLVNILGSFAIGMAYESVQAFGLSGNFQDLFCVGVLGGFTTFSTFSYNNIELLRSGELWLGSVHIVGSCALGLASVMLGIHAVKLTARMLGAY